MAIADRLGSIRQTAGPPIGRHGYMAIVWLGSRWLQLEHPGAAAVPFTQYRLLHDFGWGDSGQPGPPGPQAHAARTSRRRAGRARSTTRVTGRKTHEDHFGIIDRVLWPVVQDGRVERLGYIFLGSWFLDQLRHEAGAYLDWAVIRDLPPIARKLYGLLENDRFEPREDGQRVAGATGWGRRSSPAWARPARASATTWPRCMRAGEAIERPGSALPLRARADADRGRLDPAASGVARSARPRAPARRVR